jgi:hypothetical protein
MKAKKINPLAGVTNAAKKRGLKVKLVDSRRLKDYAGMNDLIAKKLGFKCPPKTIMADKHMSMPKQRQTLRHEIIERGHMANGMPYWKAHKIALKQENKRLI